MQKTLRVVDLKLLKELRKKPCFACGSSQTEIHHIKSKKSGGHDVISNLWPLCRKHHDEVHRSLNRFVSKYNLSIWLCKNGWEYSTITNKWFFNSKGGVI